MKIKTFLTGCITSAVMLATSVYVPAKAQQVDAIKIDGNANDWAAKSMEYDKDTKLYYAVGNDKDGINILIKSGDRGGQMKILNAGMQILVDTKGKKNKSTGINYPMPGKNDRAQMDHDQQPRQEGESHQPDMKAMRQRILSQKKELELFGFSDDNNGVSDIGFSPVNVAIGWDDKDTMIYEVHIPFSTFAKVPAPGEKISIGIVSKGMKMPEMNGGGDRDAGGQHGGGFGGDGNDGGGHGRFGGPGGMQGGGDRGDMQKMLEENSFWTKYTLNS